MQMSGPCHECPDRYIGCHGACERYKEYTDKLSELRAMRAEKMRAEDDVNGFVITSAQRIKARCRDRGKR